MFKDSICGCFAVVLFAALGISTAAVADTYHIAPEGSDTSIGTSDAPLLTFSAAFAKCSSGDEVVAADGVYVFRSPAKVPNGVTVRSATGDAEKCILDGCGSTWIFETAESSPLMGIRIAGFTFRNARNTLYGVSGLMESGGGAIRFSSPTNCIDSASVISNCVFNSCHSDTGYGGAVMIPGGTTVSHCTFTNCTAMMKGEDGTAEGLGARGGGAIYALPNSVDVIIRNTVFVDCGASNGVGVVNAGDYLGAAMPPEVGQPGSLSFSRFSVILDRCEFSNNWSYGSTACLNMKARRVKNCVFSGNRTYSSVLKDGTATDPRAVVWQAETIGVMQIDNRSREGGVYELRNEFISCVFDSNSAQSGGGVIYYNYNSTPQQFTKTALLVSNCVFTANTVPGRNDCGSLILAHESAPVTLVDSEFSRNRASGTASSLYGYYPLVALICNRDGSHVRVERCRFFNNESAGNAGLLYISPKNASVIDCEFVGNVRTEAQAYCAGVVYTRSKPKNIVIRGCLFASNTNKACIGTSYTPRTEAQVWLANYELNKVSGMDGPVTIESCTFADNYCKGRGESKKTHCGIVHTGGSDTARPLVRNCVFVNNRRKDGTLSPSYTCDTQPYDEYDLTKMNAIYNIEDGDYLPKPGFNNISGVEVKFNAAALAEGKYIPRRGVWANSGIYCDWMEEAVDIYGSERVRQRVVDRGCAEGWHIFGMRLNFR